MIKSEAFSQSYCIFVSVITEGLKNKIKSYGIPGIKLLRATFQDKLFCIVIPNHHAYKVYESELFNLYKKEIPDSGFWGQYSMGYKDKEWDVVI